MRPDPYSGSYSLSNPQSFNRYAYALNNPLGYVDPSGQDCIYPYDYDPGLGYSFDSESGYTIVRGDCVSIDDDGVYVDGNAYFDTATIDPTTRQATLNFGVNQYTADYSTSVQSADWYSTLAPVDSSGTQTFPASPNLVGSTPANLQSYCSSAYCHVPNYVQQKRCDVPGECTAAEKAQWCAGAEKMAAFGLQATGGAGTGPVVTGTLGILTRFLPVIDEVIGSPLAAVGGAQGMAAYTANYVDGVCKAD